MVAVVSHEIKNPLMIIRASAERILKKTGAGEADYIVEEIDRLDEIVTGYLDFANTRETLIDSDHEEDVVLAELIGNLKIHINQKYPEEEITWTSPDIPRDITLSLPIVDRLRQVLLKSADKRD